MVVIVSLGGVGRFKLNCYTKDNADSVANRFINQNKFPKLFKRDVVDCVKEK
jgi:hypothetical protein